MKKSSKRGFISWTVLILIFNLGALFAQERSATQLLPRKPTYDALHYKINLRFNEEEKSFSGEVTVTLTPLSGNFSSFELDAADMIIDKVILCGGKGLEFQTDYQRILISLDQVYNSDDTLTVSVRYHATPSRGLYFRGPDEKDPNAPHQIFTYSEPEDAHYWFPCFDSPADKATTEVIATVKDTYLTLSNGRLLEVKENKAEGTKTWYWLQDKPHSPYLVTFVAGEYVALRDSCDGLPVDYYVYESNINDAPRSFEKTPDMIKFFSEKFGYPYPWDKYAQVIVYRSITSGMEHTSATTLTDRTIHDRRAHIDISSDGLVAHELAHQWFGDLVTCKDWAHLWLNEGFATYAVPLYTEVAKGKDEALYQLMQEKDIYLNETRTRYIRPIVYTKYTDPKEVFNRHVYQKGAWVLRMLRYILGDEQFFAVLKYYLHKHAFDVVGTYDLKVAIEEATGQNLQWFFEEWLYKAGHPEFEVDYTWNDAAKTLTLHVKQTQKLENNVPIFKTPVDVELTSASEKKIEKVFIDEKEETFTFSLNTKPLMVRFDKGNRILKTLKFKKSREELLYQLKNDDDVTGRLWVLTQLEEMKDNRKVIKALGDALLNDSFWAVRAKAAKTLSGVKGKDVKFVLLQGCKDPNSKVRRASIRALGKMKDPANIPVFQEAAEKDSSYFVAAEAYLALAETGDTTVCRILLKALDIDSHREIIRTAALQGLRKLNDRRALPFAMEYVNSAKPINFRFTAMQILRTMGKGNEKVEDILITLLDDSSPLIRISAINTLAEFKSTKSLTRLQEIERTESNDRIKRAAKRAIEKIQAVQRKKD